jgi:hypothetical protein
MQAASNANQLKAGDIFVKRRCFDLNSWSRLSFLFTVKSLVSYHLLMMELNPKSVQDAFHYDVSWTELSTSLNSLITSHNESQMPIGSIAAAIVRQLRDLMLVSVKGSRFNHNPSMNFTDLTKKIAERFAKFRVLLFQIDRSTCQPASSMRSP